MHKELEEKVARPVGEMLGRPAVPCLQARLRTLHDLPSSPSGVPPRLSAFATALMDIPSEVQKRSS
jgi:hypothetical protein